MSSLVTNPTAQFIDPFFGNPCENAKIYIGYVNTDGLQPETRQPVYVLKLTDEAAEPEKIPIEQPLRTNSAGVIVYEGLPATLWVDGPYSITIVGYDEALLYQSFYVDDPTYWLRRDLATEPKKTPDGLHYDPDDNHGVIMVAGAAPIWSPDFKGQPTAPTPDANDSSTKIATTAFVKNAITAAMSVGIVGSCCWWAGSTPPTGAVVLDGSQLSKTTYKEAYAVIGDTYATKNGLVPDSSLFYVPDCRSRYIRGYDYGAGLSSYADFMKKYEDILKSHTHTIKLGGWNADGNDGGGDEGLYGTGTDANSQPTISSTGGSETMPKTLVMLPIMWVTPGSSALAAQWHAEPQYLNNAPPVHHFDAETGEILGSSVAHPSPLEPGVWLTPEHATDQAPVESKPGHVRVFRNGAWSHDADLFRQKEELKKQLRLTRERENKEIMERGNRLRQADEWLKQQGAPFSINDLLK